MTKSDAKGRVLIVDDDAMIRKALARELGPEFEVVQSSDYAEAVTCLAERSDICAVVCDCNLGSGPNGIELMKQIRQRAPGLPRITVSGNVSEELGRELIATGVAHVVIAKPWSNGAILDAVKQHLLGSRAERPTRVEPVRACPRVEATLPARILCEIWGHAVELQTKDISIGGAFIQTGSPPPLHSSLELSLRGPDGSSVRVEGRVAHIVSPERAGVDGRPFGFGVEFVRLTPEQAQMVQTIIDTASRPEIPKQVKAQNKSVTADVARVVKRLDPAATPKRRPNEDDVLQRLGGELASLKEKDCFGVLGLDSNADAPQTRAAFLRVSKEYHPDLYARYADREIRAVATEVFIILKQSYSKLSDQVSIERYKNSMGKPAGSVGRAESEPPLASAAPVASMHAPRVSSPSSLDADDLFADVEQTEHGHQPVLVAPLVSEALNHIAHGRHGEAIDLFKQALDIEPGNTKAKIWLLVAEARRLKVSGKIEECVARYKEILGLDDKHIEAVQEVRAFHEEGRRSRGIFSRILTATGGGH
ncbi:MAG: hypothetical protein A2341_08320 [Deltaproteobacteria bacterium RIFOXYB12_FULL_58_9]|nr:MAG: hypothetical protein A2341_08320 [Deltaproteobacteria bacterium RIFOXYB12_FULL_58_9]